MKKQIVIYIIVFFALPSFAQQASSIASGRPGQAIDTQVVGKGVFQVESGLDYLITKLTSFKATSQVFNNVLRLGLSERFEVSTVIDYQEDTFETNTTETSINGVSQWQLGFRYNLIPEHDGWIPTLGIQTRFRMKNVSENYRRDQVAPIVMASANSEISKRFSLTANGGVSYSGLSFVPTYIYILSLTQSLGACWATTYEAYGNESNDLKSSYLGVGLSYLINSDFQLDAYMSNGNNSGIKEFYSTLGLSWRTQLF